MKGMPSINKNHMTVHVDTDADLLTAVYREEGQAFNLRTKAGRKRLNVFIDRLVRVHNAYSVEHGGKQ